MIKEMAEEMGVDLESIELDEINEKNETNIYENVIICTGANSDFTIPEIENFKNFKGEYMHSSKFKNPEELVKKYKNILKYISFLSITLLIFFLLNFKFAYELRDGIYKNLIKIYRLVSASLDNTLRVWDPISIKKYKFN